MNPELREAVQKLMKLASRMSALPRSGEEVPGQEEPSGAGAHRGADDRNHGEVMNVQPIDYPLPRVGRLRFAATFAAVSAGIVVEAWRHLLCGRPR